MKLKAAVTASPRRSRRRLTSGWSDASVGFGPSSFFLTGGFGAPAAAPAAGVVAVFAAPGVAGVFATPGVVAGVFAAAASFNAAARAFASAIFAARSRSACEGLFEGSPTSGDLPPGGPADESGDFAVGAADVSSFSLEAAGTVVPDTELPDGALPVSAA